MTLSPDLLLRFRADLGAVSDEAPDASLRLGIAVSGGPDSLALLLLAAAAFPGAIAAATVDHGVRTAAAEEARAVGAICAALAVPHRVLRAENGLPPRGSLQDRARRLRYRLLGAWAEEEALGWIATAHHLDDQAETFLMRAARGSGVAGLAGVRGCGTIADVAVPVVRPLLGWRRAELAAVVAAAELCAVDDPANRDPAHDRTAFRALLAESPRLRPEGLARAAANLAQAEGALDWVARQLAAERLRTEDGAVLLRAPHELPRELRRRLLHAAIEHFAARPPRGDSLDRLLHLIDSGRAATLGGIAVQPGPDWRLAPAPPRRG